MVFTDIKLPIDIVPGTNPPEFVWKQTVDSVVGRKVVEHRDKIPQVLEVAVERMITIVKQLLHDNAVLNGTVKGLQSRVTSQAALLEKKAEVGAGTQPQPTSLPKKK